MVNQKYSYRNPDDPNPLFNKYGFRCKKIFHRMMVRRGFTILESDKKYTNILCYDGWLMPFAVIRYSTVREFIINTVELNHVFPAGPAAKYKVFSRMHLQWHCGWRVLFPGSQSPLPLPKEGLCGRA